MFTTASVHFGWPVRVAKYEWVRAYCVNDDWSISEEESDVLVPSGLPYPHNEFVESPVYDPFKTETGLFLQMASLNPEKDAIQQFANQFGTLSLGKLAIPVGLKTKFPKPPKGCTLANIEDLTARFDELKTMELVGQWHRLGAVQGNSLEEWMRTITELTSLVGIWTGIRNGDRNLMARYVHLEVEDGFQWASLKNSLGMTIWKWSEWRKGQRQSLEQAAKQMLLFRMQQHTLSGMPLHLIGGTGTKLGELVITPKALRDAIWLQFAMAICDDKNFRQCEVCGKSFEISPETARVSRTLCSNACKAKAHRKRRAEALALFQKGRTPKQIAKQVGSQLSTVEKWIAETKEE